MDLLGWLKRRHREPEAAPAPKQIPIRVESYLSDRPVVDPTMDDFGRWPLSRRLAQTVAALPPEENLVLGVYGAWGEGKTTVLNFMEHELRNYENVVCFRFNPWRFKDEDDLLRSFFTSFAEALQTSITTAKEQVAKYLKDYGRVLAPAIPIAGGMAAQAGAVLSEVSIETQRRRVENMLRAQGKRVVVLMDDIDRLEKTEIQAVFRLVKLSADFPCVVYVLAFDEEVVAASLADQYGGQSAGHAFLGKIVQVPITLPRPDRTVLRKACFSAVDRVLRAHSVSLGQDEVNRFVIQFDRSLLSLIETPRAVKRYVNALTFALPILVDEVNMVDMMLLEGLRVFCPAVYEVVRSASEVFLGQPDYGLGGGRQKENEQARNLVDSTLEKCPADTREGILDLLKGLFPRLEGVYSNVSYGPDWDKEWTEQKRLASSRYFRRYFSYSIPIDDVSDKSLEEFLGHLGEESPELSILRARAMAAVGPSEFVQKLRDREAALPEDRARALCLIIARIADSLPDPDMLFDFRTPNSQAAILIGNLAERIPETHRFDLARDICSTAELPFAAACLRWLKRHKDGEGGILDDQQTKEVAGLIVERIRAQAETGVIYKEDARNAPYYLYLWNAYGIPGESQEYLERALKTNPPDAIALLKAFVGTAWSANGPHLNRMHRETYDAMTRLVPADAVSSAIEAALLKPQDASSDELSSKERDLGQQFLQMHQAVTANMESQDSTEAREKLGSMI